MARLFQLSCHPLQAGHVFRDLLIHHCYGLSGCSPPLTDLIGFCPGHEGFYIQAFSESVTFLTAGHHYDRVTFCGCLCFEPSFARYLPSSLESRTRTQIRFFVRNSLGLGSRWLVREYSQPLALRAVRIRSPVMGSRIVVFNLSLAVARWNPSLCDSPEQSRKVPIKRGYRTSCFARRFLFRR